MTRVTSHASGQGALRRLADAYPDAQGQNTAISAALQTKLVQAFVIHPAHETTPQYLALVLKFARDPLALTTVRKKLAANRETCPLFDTARFTRDLERAYTTMVERARKNEPPTAFNLD